MSGLPDANITMAISDYEHVRDLTSGDVRAEGINLTCLRFGLPEMFHRFLKYREWDVSEVSFAKYVSLRASGDESLVAIPVFPSRVFRHSAIFVRTGIFTPQDLVGARVGVPEWAQTAGVYARAALVHEYGIDLAAIQWVQAGVNETGRKEKVALSLPPGISVRCVADRSLDGMLVSGEIDAVISAQPPASVLADTPGIGRLFPNYREVELEYGKRTGIVPVMHVVVMTAEVFGRHRWAAMNLLTAFEEAKRRSIGRLRFMDASMVPLPWVDLYLRDLALLFDGDWWPYGVDRNRVTLEAFLGFAHEQGVIARRMTADELFPPEVLEPVRA